MLRNRSADIRKCALFAALISAVCVVALEMAGSALTASYSGLGGKLEPRVADGAPIEMAPASASLR